MNGKTQLIGAGYILISALFYGSYGIWSKLMDTSFSDFNQAWIRGLLLLVMLIPYGIWRKKYKRIHKSDLKWFCIIGLAGGLNQAPYFFSFKYLGVGSATLIFYACLTLGAFVIGKLFFGEIINRYKLLAFILSLIGMFLIYQFYLDAAQFVPALLTGLAGAMGSMIVVFSKKVSGMYSEVQILTIVFGMMFVGNLIISLLLGEPIPSIALSTGWLAQFGYCVAMLIANAAVIAGFARLEPSVGGLIGLAEIIFGAFFGILLFGETMTLPMFLGFGLILAGMALPNFSKS